MTVEGREAMRRMIEEAWSWLHYHKARKNRIDALAAHIRLRALLDAREALEKCHEQEGAA